MKISKEQLDKFKKICKEKNGIEPTDEEAYEDANKLLDFFKILLEVDVREQNRKKKLKEFPDGFYIDDDGIYNCPLCKRRISKAENNAYYDSTGLKCIDCRNNIKNKKTIRR